MSEAKGEEFADDAFLMVSQLHWEDDVVWNGDDIKHKVSLIQFYKINFTKTMCVFTIYCVKKLMKYIYTCACVFYIGNAEIE